jgi:energy-coupling factor transporter ATP-binding protein EcfA2
MRIRSVSGAGVLSFDHFGVDLHERATFVVGPNGAGKSNLTKLLDVCLRAVESGDGGAGDADRLLGSFLAARYIGSQSPRVEARVALQFTDAAEQDLVTEFVRAMAVGVLTARRQAENMAELDGWAETTITRDALEPMLEGEVVASHPGTPDGQWQCAYEFIAAGRDGAKRKYSWVLLGLRAGAIAIADTPPTYTGRDAAECLTGSSSPPPGPLCQTRVRQDT